MHSATCSVISVITEYSTHLMSTVVPKPDLGKKRRRTTIVCDVCKARKVRCDRMLPCSSCVKHKTTHLCSYDETIDKNELRGDASDSARASNSHSQHSSPALRSDPELTYSKYCGANDVLYLAPTTPAKVLANFSSLQSVIGVNPLASPDDTVNFFLGYNPISQDPETFEECNHGPFSWHSLVRLDPALGLVWRFMFDIKPRENNEKDDLAIDAAKRKLQLQLQVLDRIRQQLVKKFDVKKVGLLLKNLPLGLTFNDPNLEKENVGFKERLLGILPLKKIVWSHINRFFRILYPFFPYLDEVLFRERIARLLGPTIYEDTRATSVNITARTDSAYIGILCILLRLSYLSLISNDSKNNQKTMELESDDAETLELRLLLLCPIGIEFVDFARTCLNLYQVGNRSNLIVLQLIVFTRIYMEVSPEDSEGPARDMFQVNNGVLLQLANTLGLNRDPDVIETLSDPKVNNIRRKLWAFIQFRDVANAVKFGSPFVSAAFASDTKFPYLDNINANCCTEGIDMLVDRAFRPLEKLLPLMKDVIQKILQVDKGTLVVELVQSLNNLEVYLFENYGTLRDVNRVYLENTAESIEKLIQLPYYVPIQVFIVSVYFHLYLHYENTYNLLAFFYCKKILTIITRELLPYTYDMLEKPHPFFQYASQLVVNPHLEYILHRSVGFLAAFIVRLGNHILAAKSNGTASDPKILHLKFLMRSLSRCSKVCLLGIHKINHRYCYAWRIGTTFTYIVRSLVSEGFYERIRAHASVRALEVNFDDLQIRDLIGHIQPLMDHVDLSGFGGYWNIVHDVIKLGKPESGREVLFNPMDSKIVFEGLPKTLNELDARTSELPSEFDIDPHWFPAFSAPNDFDNVMGRFFGGPESYFEVFNASTNQTMLDDYGIGGGIGFS